MEAKEKRWKHKKKHKKSRHLKKKKKKDFSNVVFLELDQQINGITS